MGTKKMILGAFDEELRRKIQPSMLLLSQLRQTLNLYINSKFIYK